MPIPEAGIEFLEQRQAAGRPADGEFQVILAHFEEAKAVATRRWRPTVSATASMIASGLDAVRRPSIRSKINS